MSIPHPIPYQGSKRAFASIITAYFPKNIDRLVEPFAGSAAVSLAAAYYGRAQKFFLSDTNQALINLWDEIINRPGVISDAYEVLWRSQLGRERKFYDTVRTEFNQTQRPGCFLYLLARCVKASVRYNPKGGFNQSPDNRRKGAEPSTMRARIFGASHLLKGKTELACADYRQTLANVVSSDIVYMDPPYKGVCRGKDRRYKGTLSFDEMEFIETLKHLTIHRVPFIVSYDGRTGDKTFGETLPQSLGLAHLEIDVGRSSQATLLGRDANTVESLYLSADLLNLTDGKAIPGFGKNRYQYPLFAVGV